MTYSIISKQRNNSSSIATHRAAAAALCTHTCTSYFAAGLPTLDALVVTHLCSYVELGDSSFIPFLHDGRLSRGSCFVPKPLVYHLRCASQAIPTRSQYLCPGNYRPCQGCSRQIPVHLRVIRYHSHPEIRRYFKY